MNYLGMLKTLESFQAPFVLVFVLFFGVIMFRIDRRMMRWDKNISVKNVEYDGKFTAINTTVGGHSSKIKEHEERLDDHGERLAKVETVFLIDKK